ncbi:hypothetical protein [Methanobrevibacter sp.]|uniref:hypothetical protein n=1 Tax=Methanobrevibacter sp. TaxID=66852 RepID=UPI0026DEFD6F|nr:hypothetical protein [Methanobrevibacter sp.]MDO5859195.1 hypothetical protein [Methanobrevibacter sp.]
MLHPKDYRKEFESANLKKILQERDRIIEFMHDFENDNIPEKYYERDPSPELIYFRHIEYLKEICDLMIFKMDKKDGKIVRLTPFLAIEEVISKFDEERRKQFFADLKVKDEELYSSYMKWKEQQEND